MKQTLLHRDRVLWTALHIGLAFVLLIVGQRSCAAQSSPCYDICIAPGIIGNPDWVNPFNAPRVTDTGQPNGNSRTVTMQQLRHKVPAKAQKEMDKALHELEKDHGDEAIAHLQDAVLIDPEFVAARNDLAAVYLRANNPEPAIEQLNSAIELDPNFPTLFVNLAIGYELLAEFGPAERAAREAMELDRVGNLPRYLLLIAIVYQKSYTEEALRLATRVRDQYPLAHLFGARILLSMSNFEGAEKEIHEYLSGTVQIPAFTTVATSWLQYIAGQDRQAVASIP